MSDSTERKRTEEMLQDSEELYRSILKASPDNITITDLEGHILKVSPSALSMFGWARETEVIGRLVDEFLVPEDRERAKRTLMLRHQGAFSGLGEYCGLRADGSTFTIEVNAEFIRNAAGHPTGMVFIIRDITERRQTAEALRASEMRWMFALEGSGDGVWDWNVATNEVFFSRQWKAMLGYSEEEFENRLIEWERRINPEDREKYYTDLEKHFSGETDVYQNELRLLCKDGTYKWFLDRGKIVEWTGNGKPLRMIGTHTDITFRKQAEEAMRQAKEAADAANLAKSRFLSMIAHEFHTPLGLLTVSVDILDHYWERLDKIRRTEQHEQIRRAARQMSHLVDSVLAFSNPKSARPLASPLLLDVGRFCHGIAEEVKAVWYAGHEFRITIAPECGTCPLDEILFRRVLVNLLSNAFRFTPPGGTVSLMASRCANKLIIEVSDTGIGIPEDDRERIFEAFYRSRNVDARNGLGLGLSIASEALQQMNGSITLTGKVGEGSTFRVLIPVESDPATKEHCSCTQF